MTVGDKAYSCGCRLCDGVSNASVTRPEGVRTSGPVSTPAIMQSSTRPSISLVPLVHDNNDPAPHSPSKHYQVPRTGITFFPHRVVPIARHLSQLSFSQSCPSSHYYSWPYLSRSLRPLCKPKILPLLAPGLILSKSLASMNYFCVFIRSWSHACSPSTSVILSCIIIVEYNSLSQ